ncbi:hypothetical protein OAB01_00700 [Bacteroidia bacterium]|nr:hypothetical protein [Bacteroidia bacterium]
MRKSLIIGLLLLCSSTLVSKQDDSILEHLQYRLNRVAKAADSLTLSANQGVRLQTAQWLNDSLEEILSFEESFILKFDSFKTVSIQSSEDERVRLFTWNYFNDTGFYTVFGILQLNPQYYDEFLYPLEPSKTAVDTSFQTLSPDQWIPALYYGIYTYKYKRKCYYILTGYHGATPYLDQRIVEVLYIDKKEGPQFGKPIFFEKNAFSRPKSRLIFNYASEASMVCRVEKDEKILVISHLVPVRWQKKGNFEYYTPDGSYDFYQYRKGVWKYSDHLNDFNKIGNKELKGKFKTE